LDWKRLTPIVGPSRDKISEKDHKEKNRVPVLDKVGNIIWLKNEFEVEYKFFFVSFLHFECHFLWEKKFQGYFMIQFSPITIFIHFGNIKVIILNLQ
jgi:hypothetical protein